MRLAIKNTNVVLNMAITPGIILIPSDMIGLKEKVAGYNNVLTLATKDMKFGVNKDINYVEPSEDVTPTTQGVANLTTPPIIPKTTQGGEQITLPGKRHPRGFDRVSQD